MKRSISNLSLIFQPNEQTLQGSFSSASTPNFARKYSLESSGRDLQDLHIFTCFCTAQTSIFQNIFVKHFRTFRQNLQTFNFTHDSRKKFIEICSALDDFFQNFAFSLIYLDKKLLKPDSNTSSTFFVEIFIEICSLLFQSVARKKTKTTFAGIVVNPK